MLKPIFEKSLIKELYLTDEIRYIEFTNQAEFQSCMDSFFLEKLEMLYYGEHRIENNKWIIVIKEQNEKNF